jgi:YidC/Oxa1 family membrane protein insertase
MNALSIFQQLYTNKKKSREAAEKKSASVQQFPGPKGKKRT